jgi:hypothetical protein
MKKIKFKSKFLLNFGKIKFGVFFYIKRSQKKREKNPGT